MKKGDIVYLKSGSPKLTISKIDGTEITAFWYDGDSNKVLHEIFEECTLVKEESLDKNININIANINAITREEITKMLLEIIKDCQISN